jgi:hypothetical protein
VIRYEKEPDSPLIRDIQAFLSLDPQAEPERRYDYEEVIFPTFEAPDEYERFDAITIVGSFPRVAQRASAEPVAPAGVHPQYF